MIFTWDLQRERCCHSSGSLAFDAAGQPAHRHGRQHRPVRVRRLRADRRARRPAVLRRPAHVGQHEQPQRQDPADHAGPGRHGRPRARHDVHGPDGQPLRRGQRHDEPDAARDLRDGLPQPVPAHRRPEDGLDPDGRLRPGRRRRPTRTAARRAASSTTSSRARATTAGPTASATTSRTTTTTSPRARPARSSTARRRSTTRRTTPGLTNLPPARPATMWMRLHGGPTQRFPGLGTRRRAHRRPALRLRPRPRLRHEVPRVLRRPLVHRRVEQRLDQDARRSTARATPPAVSTRRGWTRSPGRTRWSSALTAPSTSSTGAPASAATTSTRGSTGSTT